MLLVRPNNKKNWLNDNMTTAEQIKRLIPQGETTTVQFKVRSEDT